MYACNSSPTPSPHNSSRMRMGICSPCHASALHIHVVAFFCAVNQKVRIHNIGIKGPKDGHGPKQVKLFINRHSFGFSDADSVPCAQQLDLTEKDLDGEPIPLKLTKVSSCSCKVTGGLVTAQPAASILQKQWSPWFLPCADVRVVQNSQQGVMVHVLTWFRSAVAGG